MLTNDLVITRRLRLGKNAIVEAAHPDGVISTVNLLETVSVLDDRFIPIEEHAAIRAGTSTYDCTAGIQAAINAISKSGILRIPTGIYNISSTLIVDGQIKSINIVGDTSVHAGAPGGVNTWAASILLWTGANNGVMMLMQSTNGSNIEGVWFHTSPLGFSDPVITGVYGVRYINRNATIINTIRRCNFGGLYAGVHYYDDGLHYASDWQMDGNLVEQCYFHNNNIGILVDQTNVYDTAFRRCSFYGSDGVAKHHVWIKKGHAYIQDCYLGGLKNAASPGGKDGIAIYVQNGLANLYNCYSEANNGPFFVWESASPNGIGCVIVGCWVVADPLTIPTTYNILNSTNNTISLIGGTVGKAAKQAVGTSGAILLWGTTGVADSTGELNRVVIFNSIAGRPGLFGTYPCGAYGASPTAEGGKATIEGFNPQFFIRDLTDNGYVVVDYLSGLLKFNRPGQTSANGPIFDYTNGILDLFAGAVVDWGLKISGSTTKRLHLGAAVTISRGAGSPEGVVTANPGSMYSNENGGAGTTLYVKESGSGNTGWVGK